MLRSILLFLFLATFSNAVIAQTREELEKQRKQLRKDIEEAQKILGSNNAQLKNSLGGIITLGHEIDLRSKVVANLGQDLNILDNNIFAIQKDIIRYDRLLDTLRQEYAKSMIYAYKNRGDYEFLNFIFSAGNFNDAIKRVAYLKSYRSYREMQGENILRTQELRKIRLEDLGASKQEKNTTLDLKSKEVEMLEEKKKQQNEIALQLQKKGKDINTLIAAKQKQMAKINSAVKAAIAKAMKDEDDKRNVAIAATPKGNSGKSNSSVKTTASSKTNINVLPAGTGSVIKPVKPLAVPKDFNKENITLSADFKSNIGRFQWPVDNGLVIQHRGITILESNTQIYNAGITIKAETGAPVKAIFDGVVILALEIEEGIFVITVKHGDYYTTYSNVTSVTIKKDQHVTTNQIIGKVAANMNGIGAIDFQTAKGKAEADPEDWLRRK